MTRKEFMQFLALNPELEKRFFWDANVNDPQRYEDRNGGRDSIHFFFDEEKKMV